MIRINPNRPYFEAWLRRTGRQLGASGRLTQVATALSASEGGTVESWRSELRELLEGNRDPSLELLTRIDGLLAGARKVAHSRNIQATLDLG